MSIYDETNEDKPEKDASGKENSLALATDNKTFKSTIVPQQKRKEITILDLLNENRVLFEYGRIISRMFVLILFNDLFPTVFKYINTCLIGSPLTRQTLSIKNFIFTGVKNPLWNDILDSTRALM